MIHFLHQQTDELLGYLDGNEGRTYWDDEHKQEVSGLNVLSFTMPSNIEEAAYADERNRILVRHERGGWQEFIIYNTVTTGTEIRVVATGAEIEMNKLKVVTPKRHEAKPLAQMLSAGVDGIDWELGDIIGAGTQTREFDKFLGGYDFVKQVANTYGVELIFRTEVSGSRVVGRYIDAVKRAGQNRGKEFVAGKDIIDIEREMHADRIVTALFCVGPEPQDDNGNETGEERLTTLVTDPDAFQRWNRKGQHIIEVYEPQSNDQDMTMAQLQSYGAEELRKRIAAVVEYKIEAADLSALYPHEEAYLADDVRVIDEEFVPPLYAEARIISVTRPIIEDETEPVEKTYTIGEVFVRRKEDVTRNFEQIAKRFSTKIIRAETAPTGATNVIWIKTGANLPFDVAHAWDGSQWVPVTAQSAEDIGADPAGSAAAALQTARGEIADVTDRLDNIEGEIDQAFIDGIVSEAEAKSIAQHVNTLNVEKQDVDSGYSELYANPALSGAPKTNLYDAKTGYNTAHTALIGAINQAALDSKVTYAERTNVDSKFTDYRSALGAYSTAFTVASNAVSAKHAADAQAAAVQAAATDAKNKADAAQAAAIAAADTKAEAEREIAKAYADDIVDDEEAARIEALRLAAIDAQNAADTAAGQALSSAKSYADTAKDAAIAAAATHADAKAEAERVLAEAYADDIVDEEERVRIEQAQANLATAKSHADTAASTALASAKSYADTAASNAEAAANTHADAKAEAERVLAEAYADDVVDEEERLRIEQAQANLATAKSYADTKKAEAITAAETYADTAASAAEAAAISAASTKAEAEREIAKAYADDIVTNEEEERIADVKARLVTAKAYADTMKAEAITAAATEAQTKADEAQRLAEVYAATQVDVLEISDRNLILNSDFSKGTEHWSTHSGTSFVVNELGNLVVTYPVGNANNGGFDQNISLEPGIYTASAKIKRSSDTLKPTFQLGSLNHPKITAHPAIDEWGVITQTYELTSEGSVLYLYDGVEPVGTLEVEWIKLQRGSKATDWTPAPEDVAADALAKAVAARDEAIKSAEEYTDLLRDDFDEAINDINTAITGLTDITNSAFLDGIIDIAEREALASQISTLENEKSGMDAQYAILNANPNLIDEALTNLVAAKSAYDTEHGDLIAAINTAIADSAITAAEKAAVDSAFTAYRSAFATLQTRFEEALDGIAHTMAVGTIDSATLIAKQEAAGVVDSEDFKNALDKKADSEALGDYAPVEEVKRVEDSIPDAVQKGIDGIDFSEYATNTDLANTEDELKKSLSATTGLNMIRNSIGYAGLDYWEHTTAEEVVSTMMNEQLKTLGYGSGFYFPASTGAKGIQQTVRVRPGVEHTISWFVNKATAGTFEVAIYEDGALKMTVPDVSEIDGEFDSNYIPYTPETGLVTIRFTASGALEATLSGVMMGLGNLPTQWTLANGELYNAYVRVDDSGLVVLRVDENGDVEGFTNMTPEEFAGYYDENRDGNFERIFYFNRDETVTKKLRAKEEITMGTIKIVRVEGATNRGWAFVPIVRDES